MLRGGSSIGSSICGYEEVSEWSNATDQTSVILRLLNRLRTTAVTVVIGWAPRWVHRYDLGDEGTAQRTATSIILLIMG